MSKLWLLNPEGELHLLSPREKLWIYVYESASLSRDYIDTHVASFEVADTPNEGDVLVWTADGIVWAPVVTGAITFGAINGQIGAGQVPLSVVSQHQGSLAIAWGQLTGVPSTFAPSAHTHPFSELTGQIAAVQVPLAAVSQFEGNLSIGWGQLTGVPSTFAPSAHTHPWADLSSFVGSSLAQLATRNYSDLQNIPSTFAPSAHTHPFSQITGTIADDQVTETSVTQFEGDLSIAWGQLTGVPTTLAGYGITDAASDAELLAHTSRTDNPHAVTAAQVGLGLVENTALSTWAGSANITTLGTIASGQVPAARVTAGSFGSGDYTFNGVVTILGGTAATPLTVNNSATDPAAGSSGIGITNTYTYGATSTSTFRGLNYVFVADVGATFSLSNATAIRGLTFIGRASGAGTIASLIAEWVRSENTGTGTVTRAFGGVDAAHTNSGGGTVVTAVGRAIEQQTVGTTNVSLFLASGSLTSGLPGSGDYAIYSAHTGFSVLVGGLSLGGTPTAGSTMEVTANTGSSSIVPAIMRVRSRSSGNGWLNGAANYWGAYDFYSDDSTAPPGPSVRARLSAHMESTTADRVGVAMFVGPTGGPTLSQTWNSDLSVLFAGAVSVTGNLTSAGDLALASTKRVYLDGVAATGDTYVHESAANVLGLVAGGVTTLALTSTLATITGALTVTGIPILTGGLTTATTVANPSSGSGATSSAIGMQFAQDASTNAGLSFIRWGSAAGTAPAMLFTRSRAAEGAIGTTVNDGDIIGRMVFAGDDGVDLGTHVARITVAILGTPAANRLPGAIQFSTASGLADNALTTRFAIGPIGDVAIAALGKLLLDGVALTGDTYIHESAANTIGLVAGGTTTLSLTSSGATVTGLLAVTAGASFRTSALATNATTGHLFIPSSAGPPTGVPASIPTGQVAFQYDSTNHRLYVYSGAWRSTAALT